MYVDLAMRSFLLNYLLFFIIFETSILSIMVQNLTVLNICGKIRTVAFKNLQKL